MVENRTVGPAPCWPAEERVLTPEEVIVILRLDDHAPRAPREALRSLVRQGRLKCLRAGPGKHGRMIFLSRHVRECLDRWERWGGDFRRQPAGQLRQTGGMG